MRLLGALLYGLAICAVLTTAAWATIDVLGYPAPPSRPERSTGHGFRLERQGQHVVHVTGDPYTLGFENSRLLAPYMAAQEEELMDMLFAFAKTPAKALLLRQVSLLYLAGFDQFLTLPERQEILGLAEGAPDPIPSLGHRYGRLAAYHAIHELSHRFAFDNPLFACSLIGVSSRRGLDGHTLLARNFDFEGGDAFDQHKIVLAIRPETGFGFVAVTWSGMAGVVSGINEKGLAIVINAGASADYRRVGTPTTLLVRRALEQASTIDEAATVLTSAPPFITDILGLADRSGRVAVLELTPKRHALRTGQVVLATNHLEAENLKDDAVSLARARTTTTVQRRRRLTTLVEEHPEPLGPIQLLAMLRDRAAAGGAGLPLGHRHAIDALIATHSVIFDATAGRVYVSVGPHTLGKYLGYDVSRLLAANDEPQARGAFVDELPGDPLLAAYPLVRQARQDLPRAYASLRSGDLLRTAVLLKGISRVMPDHPATLRLKGLLAAARGEPRWARSLLTAALEAPPEYAGEAEAIAADLQALGPLAPTSPDARGEPF